MYDFFFLLQNRGRRLVAFNLTHRITLTWMTENPHWFNSVKDVQLPFFILSQIIPFLWVPLSSPSPSYLELSSVNTNLRCTESLSIIKRNSYGWQMASAFPWRILLTVSQWERRRGQPHEQGHFAVDRLTKVNCWSQLGETNTLNPERSPLH